MRVYGLLASHAISTRINQHSEEGCDGSVVMSMEERPKRSAAQTADAIMARWPRTEAGPALNKAAKPTVALTKNPET